MKPQAAPAAISRSEINVNRGASRKASTICETITTAVVANCTM